jgi:hypothetical protein
MTVESDVESEKELDGLEARHICPERALADLLALANSQRSNARVH